MEQDDIQKNKKEIINLLSSTDREGIDDLLKWLENSDFFTAPASTKYHLHTEGGLAQHSLNVYKIFKKFIENFNLDIPEHSIIICGLLHDTHKIGIYGRIDFGHHSDLPLGDGEKSVIVLQKFILLTDDELLAIRWHNGMYDVGYSSRRHYETAIKSYPLTLLLHFADMYASRIIEAEK